MFLMSLCLGHESLVVVSIVLYMPRKSVYVFTLCCVLCHCGLVLSMFPVSLISCGGVYSVLYVLLKCSCLYSLLGPVSLLSCVNVLCCFLCLVSLFHVFNVFVSCAINLSWQCL